MLRWPAEDVPSQDLAELAVPALQDQSSMAKQLQKDRKVGLAVAVSLAVEVVVVPVAAQNADSGGYVETGAVADLGDGDIPRVAVAAGTEMSEVAQVPVHSFDAFAFVAVVVEQVVENTCSLAYLHWHYHAYERVTLAIQD